MMRRGVLINEKPNQGVRERITVGIHCCIASNDKVPDVARRM
jgi:hypothetical protein